MTEVASPSRDSSMWVLCPRITSITHWNLKSTCKHSSAYICYLTHPDACAVTARPALLSKSDRQHSR